MAFLENAGSAVDELAIKLIEFIVAHAVVLKNLVCDWILFRKSKEFLLPFFDLVQPWNNGLKSTFRESVHERFTTVRRRGQLACDSLNTP